MKEKDRQYGEQRGETDGGGVEQAEKERGRRSTG